MLFNSCREKSKTEINISKTDALEIAKRYGIYGDSVEIYFKKEVYLKNSLEYKLGYRELLFWRVQENCNHCGIIQIDAISGKVIFQGKYDYQY